MAWMTVGEHNRSWGAIVAFRAISKLSRYILKEVEDAYVASIAMGLME
jgi:hypothetical protein